MPRNTRRGQRPQSPKPIRASSEIFPIRRPVDESDFEKLGEFTRKILESREFEGCGRLFVPQMMALTVVGWTRFTKDQKFKGPKTIEVMDKVESCNEPILVRLGALGIYGSGGRYKLAAEVHSTALHHEIAELEIEYERAGFPLRADRNADRENHLHLSLGQVYTHTIDHMRLPTTLSGLNEAAGQLGTIIEFQPPFRQSNTNTK